MLPALSPTQTVSRSDGKRSASPDCRIQWHRYRASPPCDQQDVGLLDHGNPAFFVDAGQRGQLQHSQGLPTQLAHRVRGSCPRDELPCPRQDRPSGARTIAVGMQRALDSAIGLPSRSTSASWMLAFLMPADVRRNLMLPPGVVDCRRERSALTDPYAVETGRPPKTHRLRPEPASPSRGLTFDARGSVCPFESLRGWAFGPESGELWFRQPGVDLTVLEPGRPNGLYHAESQEAFLVLAGECAPIVVRLPGPSHPSGSRRPEGPRSSVAGRGGIGPSVLR